MMAESQRQAKQQYRQLAFGYVAAYVVLFIGVCFGVTGRVSHLHTTQHAPIATTSTENEICRIDPLYWITGNARWESRWEGTGKDTWLALASTVATLWLICEYWRYARSCDHTFNQLPPGIAQSHVLQLRRVFMQSILIHTCTGILVWWMPIFWVAAALTFINAWQTRQLNSTKTQLLHTHEPHTLTAAMRTATLQTTDDTQIDAHGRLDQATTLLMQRVH